jgi:hypothetical protein
MPLEQREVISNAAFYFVHKQDFARLFAQTSVVTDMTIPVISFVTTPDTITTVDTGTSIDLTINKWFA